MATYKVYLRVAEVVPGLLSFSFSMHYNNLKLDAFNVTESYHIKVLFNRKEMLQQANKLSKTEAAELAALKWLFVFLSEIEDEDDDDYVD